MTENVFGERLVTQLNGEGNKNREWNMLRLVIAFRSPTPFSKQIFLVKRSTIL